MAMDFTKPHGKMFTVSRNFLSIILVCLCGLLPQIIGDFELCNPGKSTAVFQFKVTDCPFGVMFEQPVTAHCMNSTSGPETFFSDLCDADNYTFNEEERPFRIQLSFGQDNETVDAEASCMGDAPGKCNVTTYIVATNATLTEPDRADPCDYDLPEANLTAEEEERRQDAKVFNQTERMFKFIVGLISDRSPEGPKFRVVKLLRQSFRILTTYCDINYVPRKFIDDLLAAFLFLLRDSDLANFKDVSVEDYDIIMNTLLVCERMARDPFKLIGKICKHCSTVHYIEKDGQSMRYSPNEYSFEWGRQDLPVDATWGVLSFTHGLCYGTFRLGVNYHHLFQRVTETLFTPEIQYRWERPPKLFYEEIWDNMFSAPVKATMRNLDICVSAAYFNTPFLHRLDRPTDRPEGTGKTGSSAAAPAAPGASTTRRRRKRSAVTPPMTLDLNGLTGAGWCFQSREDLLATTQAYVDTHCPGVEKPLTELQELFKSKNWIDLENNENATESDVTGGDSEVTSTPMPESE